MHFHPNMSLTWRKENSPERDWGHLLTLTMNSDDLESHIVVNDSSTLTNTTVWFVVALFHCGHTYGWRTFLPGLLGHLRRWPKNIVVNVSSTLTNTTIWFVAALSLIVDVRTYIQKDGRTYGRTFLSGLLGHFWRDDLMRLHISQQISEWSDGCVALR